MQTVAPGASHLEVTPIAYGTWQSGGDWESVDAQATLAAPSSARPLPPTRPTRNVAPVQAKVIEALGLGHLEKSPDDSSNRHPDCP